MNKINVMQSRDKRPLYLQAISALTEMIESGQLPLGSQIPSEAELGEMLGISRSTLREALSHLETYGMVTRQPGRGTFITALQGSGLIGGLERLEPFRHLAEKANKKPVVIDRRVDVVEASPELMKNLNVTQDQKLIRVQIIESVDNTRVMFLEDYVIADDYPEKDLKSYEGSMLTYMIEQREPPLSHTQSKIFAIGADEKIAKKLSVNKDHPILHLAETYFDTVGEVIGVGFTYLVTEHFYFYVTRRVVPHYK